MYAIRSYYAQDAPCLQGNGVTPCEIAQPDFVDEPIGQENHRGHTKIFIAQAVIGVQKNRFAKDIALLALQQRYRPLERGFAGSYNFV